MFGSIAMFSVQCTKSHDSVQDNSSYPEKSSSGRLIEKAAVLTKIVCDKLSHSKYDKYSPL